MSLMEKLVIDRGDVSAAVIGLPTVGNALPASADVQGEVTDAFVRLTVHVI